MTIERKSGMWDAGSDMWDMSNGKSEIGNEDLECSLLISHFPHGILKIFWYKKIEFCPEKWEMGLKWEFSWLKCRPLNNGDHFHLAFRPRFDKCFITKLICNVPRFREIALCGKEEQNLTKWTFRRSPMRVKYLANKINCTYHSKWSRKSPDW